METRLSLLLNVKGNAVHTASEKDSVFDCAKKMNDLNVGALIVTENDNIKGLISERDIIRKLISCNCEVGKFKVADIMTKELLTVSLKTTVSEAMQMMTDRRFRHLPVVENKKLLGIISIGDLTKHLMVEQQKEISSLNSYIHGDHSQVPPSDESI